LLFLDQHCPKTVSLCQLAEARQIVPKTATLISGFCQARSVGCAIIERIGFLRLSHFAPSFFFIAFFTWDLLDALLSASSVISRFSFPEAR
jgi:hypothetical protein